MTHLLSFLLLIAAQASSANPREAPDLNPVTAKPNAAHQPVTLVRDGKALGPIVVMHKAAGARDLQTYIRKATGVELRIVENKLAKPAIVLGDCPEAAALGLDSSKMPPEGFAIRTTADHVFIVGANTAKTGNGQLWGAYEFLERFVGMRWYFPRATEDGSEIGQSIPKLTELAVPSVWIEDAPAFRLREIWPPMSNPWQGSGIMLGPIQTFLRGGNSWPVRIKVHAPDWSRDEALKQSRPEVFQLREDGSRQFNVLCYGNPRTLETYLEGVANFVAGKKPVYAPISPAKAITVSPADVELACYCADCRKLWDDRGGQYGGASKVMASFVDRLGREVEKRWPEVDFTVIYLPYLNYTAAPDGYKFSGNVEVQIAGMPGLAAYKEPAIREAEQRNIDRWAEISDRKIQNWHYSAWPANKTKAAYHYPHVAKRFYLENRDKTIGTFINGEYNHWPRQHISLYCWQKVLWNPEFDVDAAIDEFCKRMFGSASATMRELVGLQIDGWEKSTWPGGRFSPKGIYEASFPEARVARIRELFAQARKQAAGDELVTARLDYYEPALLEFYEEAEIMAGRGFKPLIAQKAGENPKLDGKLDDPEWERAAPNAFVQATGKTKGDPARYPTELRAVWTLDGITFGFHMHEPTPNLLETKHGGHDNGEVWWDDCVELFIDVTGKNEGEFYQFIVNPDIAFWDSKMKDTTWECPGFAAAAHRGEDFWSLEVFLPYAAFSDALVPGSGTNTVWTGNFTRHRVADKGLKSDKPPQEGSVREYQRMNTTGAATSANLADFAEIRFVE